ncbi:MAG: hypothetical protein IPO15_04770 [Anaerolineae bacterium]|uniref:hypothetical protein n=1 Tax=Candidatus Amarolinea dominans TaxID=3140696 RepID=UPI003136E1C1|nr:hypothetical protein [Anaerolineae bacterium]
MPSAAPTGGNGVLNLEAIVSIRGLERQQCRPLDIDRIVALRTLAVPGEIVRNRLTVELPEGHFCVDFVVQDNLPPGMRFINDSTARGSRRQRRRHRLDDCGNRQRDGTSRH